MEIKLQCGDTITILEGCKAIVKDGSVVFEKEEEQEFKDGDVLTSLFDNKVVFIFKEDESKQKYNKNGYNWPLLFFEDYFFIEYKIPN